MKLMQSQDRINELMSRFVTQIKGFTAMERTDLNKVAENILVPIFAELYNYRNLKNLNIEESSYPGIDLGDTVAKVAFQITSTSESEKIKNTLQKFIDHELYKSYERVIIYILTEKQKSYSGSGYEQIIQGKFSFDKDKDIWDYRNILGKIKDCQIEQVSKIEKILEVNFGDSKIVSFNFEPFSTPLETVSLNLLELSFPENLYIADLKIDREKIIKKSQLEGFSKKLTYKSNYRDVTKAFFEQEKLKFAVDWEIYNGQVITFHDLDDKQLSLRKVIDQKTIKKLKSIEFYEKDNNYERVLKTLLGRCLQQKLYRKKVNWQHEEKLFIFSRSNTDKRVETWYGERKSERTVYEKIMKKNNPDQVYYHKHLAFRTQYKYFDQHWYLIIKPEWFFSYDGYKKSFYHQEKNSWLKKKERNQQVFNHLRFISEFIKADEPSLFEKSYPFLSFGNLVNFKNVPSIDEQDWLAKEIKSNADQLILFELEDYEN